MNNDNLLNRFKSIGEMGCTISICYGYCGDDGLLYSVDVLGPDGTLFDKPYAATSFAQAIEIAENECKERGWIIKQ